MLEFRFFWLLSILGKCGARRLRRLHMRELLTLQQR
jgi:hypothetical protein